MFNPPLDGIFKTFLTDNLNLFLQTIWTLSKSSNYDGIKMSWKIKSIHDDFSFQIVIIDDSS
jgi:hypothetical protein